MNGIITVRPKAVLCALALSLFPGGTVARAGPCYECASGQSLNFRDDHVLNGLPPGGSSSAPDVAVLGDRAFVVFVDDAVTAANPGGLEQVWVAWSSSNCAAACLQR